MEEKEKEKVCSMKNRFETFAPPHSPPTASIHHSPHPHTPIHRVRQRRIIYKARRRRRRRPVASAGGGGWMASERAAGAGGGKTFAPRLKFSSVGRGGVQNFPTVRTAVQRWVLRARGVTARRAAVPTRRPGRAVVSPVSGPAQPSRSLNRRRAIPRFFPPMCTARFVS